LIDGQGAEKFKQKGPAISRKPLIYMVAEDGIEPPTRGFSTALGFQLNQPLAALAQHPVPFH